MKQYFEIVSEYSNCGLGLPSRATAWSAGFDLAAAADTIIPPLDFLTTKLQDKLFENNRHKDYYGFINPLTLDEMADITKDLKARPTLVPTGMKCKLEPDEFLAIVARSSLPLKHLLIVANAPGIVDSDYYDNEANEGHIFIQLLNLSPFAIEIKKGDKIAQGIIMNYHDDMGAFRTYTRKGGFGSTDETSSST